MSQLMPRMRLHSITNTYTQGWVWPYSESTRAQLSPPASGVRTQTYLATTPSLAVPSLCWSIPSERLRLSLHAVYTYVPRWEFPEPVPLTRLPCIWRVGMQHLRCNTQNQSIDRIAAAGVRAHRTIRVVFRLGFHTCYTSWNNGETVSAELYAGKCFVLVPQSTTSCVSALVCMPHTCGKRASSLHQSMRTSKDLPKVKVNCQLSSIGSDRKVLDRGEIPRCAHENDPKTSGLPTTVRMLVQGRHQ